jgi:hypothetical protein
MDTMALARAERADLADLLATLEPEQWNAPSLCAEWRVIPEGAGPVNPVELVFLLF